jgi:hypothetical protein
VIDFDVSHATLVAWGDALRIVVVLELAVTIGLVAVLGERFHRAARHYPPESESRRRARVIMAFGAGYAFLALFGIAEIQGYYGTILTWRSPIGFIGANLALYGLLELSEAHLGSEPDE